MLRIFDEVSGRDGYQDSSSNSLFNFVDVTVGNYTQLTLIV